MINQTHRTLSTVSVITKYIFYYYIQHILLLKIWIHKVFTIYCILFWVFYFGMTAATPKQQRSTQWVIFFFLLYLYVLSSFFKGSFHSTILHDERVFQYFLGFRFFQLSVSRFQQFSFTFSFSLFSICRPNMIYLWVFTQWHQTHWILYTEPLFVNAHISRCNICQGVRAKSRGKAYKGRMGKVDYSQHMRFS